MRWNSVRVRLTLWNVAVLALVLAGFGFALCYSVRVSLATSVDRELAEGARSVVMRWSRPRGMSFHSDSGSDPRFSSGPFSSGPFGGGPFSSGPFGGEGPRAAAPPSESSRERKGYFSRPRILDRDGNSMIPFLGDAPWDDDAFVLSLAGRDQYSTILMDKERVRVFSTPIRVNNQVEGVVQVAHSLKEQETLNSGLVWTLLTLIPVALLVAGAGGLFLAERALRPVRGITHAAAQIGAEDLSRRLEVTGKDELSELAETFNGMVGRLDEAFQRLEAAYEQQRRFVGDASHELRTPLTTIKANTSLALCGEHSVAEYREALQAADDAADTMNRIVQDLLLLARSDGGQLGLEIGVTSINQVVDRAVSVARHWDCAPIRAELPEEPVGVAGDAHYLTRLVVNLLENAARHTPLTGEIVVSVRAAGEPHGLDEPVTLTVRDTGEGIAPEHLPHVCERFYRVDASRTRARGGTGLGLAICKSIAQAHGGNLQVESELGRGTTVTLHLRPARLAPQPALADPVLA